jgi:hypothetical protein
MKRRVRHGRSKVFADDLSTVTRFIARNSKILAIVTLDSAAGWRFACRDECQWRQAAKCCRISEGPTSEALLRIFDFDAALPLYSEGLRLLDNSISEPQRKREVSSTEAPSRRTAGASGFLILSQSPERPAR